MNFRLLLFFLLFSYSLPAQENERLKLASFKTAVLNDSIQETSALTWHQGQLWTLNDSGNTGELFIIEPKSGKIKSTVDTGLKNKDWEALASDGNYLYIGDFGNNAGTRGDLKVYRIRYLEGRVEQDSTVTYPFNYSEQTDFTLRNINTDFDAEAMFYKDGMLHILTKEWASKAVSHYVLDLNISENQSLKRIESYPTGFVVTDAFYFEGKLYTVGYTKSLGVYFMIFEEDDNKLFFQKTAKKYKIGSALTVGQVEGVAVDNEGVYISAESFNYPLGKTKPYLYFIPHEKIK